MKPPGSKLEREPTTVWLVPCAWCREKYKVTVGGADWVKGEEIGYMTRVGAEQSFSGDQYRIQEVDSHGICPSCADKVEKT
ncbi:MAG: hypothetical protein A2Z96_03665 [Spirochaetes bacterium GWB1_48_6]|nr:MAG: hypothetical protein A2Z96_03665 [Spirochaetes bacterium GWB1_48_6]